MFHAFSEKPFSCIADYYRILSSDYPDFINRYKELPLLQRLSGVGLLCGTDWTPLYHNRFFYSRLDHSIGVALIVWHLTHDKKQTIAGLLHDVSTPAFSHVTDFRHGDMLKQSSTEENNERMINEDKLLAQLLAADGLTSSDVNNYHRYPVCDNEIPQLSADRLEYMFPSGMVLNGSWSMESVKSAYEDIVLLKNEKGILEPGFKTVGIAADYCIRCCSVGIVLQQNENKLALKLLGDIINHAVSLGIITENDCYTLSEKELLNRFASESKSVSFSTLFQTFTRMTSVLHSGSPIDGCYCVSCDVKKRYINPLVQTGNHSVRITFVSDSAARAVQSFCAYSDTRYGCVPLMSGC